MGPKKFKKTLGADVGGIKGENLLKQIE